MGNSIQTVVSPSSASDWSRKLDVDFNGDSSVVRAPGSRLKRPGFQSPAGAAGGFFFSTVNFLCWLFFFRCPFHPRVAAVARKICRSFCQKCRWQVVAKHTYVAFALNDTVNWCMVAWYTKDVRRDGQQFHVGTSHVTIKERCHYTTSLDIKNVL